MPSINYNHHGAPKFWYHIGRKDYKKFENFVKNCLPEKLLECSQFLRHKTIVINPYFIREYLPDIVLKKTIQREGEFVITLNSGYHTGFNFGFNIAEAVNFATPDWLPLFPKFRPCKCSNNNVYFDIESFRSNLEKSLLISGIL